MSAAINGPWQVLKNLYSGIRGFQDNLADGKPNEWRCRAGARYLYVCEKGLVHYCSQQRGYPACRSRRYTIDDIRREFCHPETVRALLHGRLRAPRVDDGLLAQPAGSCRVGRHLNPELRTQNPELFWVLGSGSGFLVEVVGVELDVGAAHPQHVLGANRRDAVLVLQHPVHD